MTDRRGFFGALAGLAVAAWTGRPPASEPAAVAIGKAMETLGATLHVTVYGAHDLKAQREVVRAIREAAQRRGPRAE